ncbi:rho GTPase-activating protein 36 [Bombina bombina]|uniref:rho GTPase-activating protein 36 n=1 Tax=Bombina bombina TaxID=8345 RepID=UPI00235AD536|nr:rho GTPase-activating protein 36 [Bombina bombina]
MLGPVLQLPAVPLQSLSELERFQLQEIALYRLREHGGCHDITADPKKRKITKRRQDKKDAPSGLFGVPLSDVIAQDRVEKQRISVVRSRRGFEEVESTVLTFRVHSQRSSHRGASLEVPLIPTMNDSMTRARRRGALSVDSITELDDGDARLLEALHLSHPDELRSQRDEHISWLSLNPIYKQVPRIVERCSSHIETFGLHTVGIFRIGSSKKRVAQLREEFAATGDVFLGEETCVHDVSALFKGFLRELPNPVLPRELYPVFIQSAGLELTERLRTLQQLIFAMPPCNADTLLRILQLLHKVSLHAEDSVSATGEKVSGNKMSVYNLAAIFGPNLLQSEDAQCMQDSAAQIMVTETLIQHYQELYTVPSNTHSDLLISLMKLDPEVTDYLLRRKLSGAKVSLDSLLLELGLGCPVFSHRPLESFMNFQDSSSQLSRRRPSRSQENLFQCTPPEPPPKSQLLPRPRFLPLFTRSSSSNSQKSPSSPSPVTLSPSTPSVFSNVIRKWEGLGEIGGGHPT